MAFSALYPGGSPAPRSRTTINMMAVASLKSPKNAETTAATINTKTSVEVNCSKKSSTDSSTRADEFVVSVFGKTLTGFAIG